MLNAFYGHDYQLHPNTPSSGGGHIMAPPSGWGNIANAQTLADDQVTAFPNPAREMVNFRYNFVGEVESAVLTIYDIKGSQVAQIHLTGTNGKIQWGTKGQAEGIYYYKTNYSGGVSTPKKLVIIR